MKPSIGAIKTLLILTSLAVSTYASAPVTVGLRTSWPAHNLLLEILETAALEDSASFFPLLDTLTNPDEFTTPLPKLAPEAIYQAALSTIKAQGYLVDETEVKRFELALSLHVASPKLQAFYQFYEDKHLERGGKVLGGDGVAQQDCASWVDWYGTKICGADDLSNVLAREGLDSGKAKPKPNQAKLLPFDHIIPDPSSTIFRPARTAVLYGDLTSSNFRSLHELLLASATSMPPKIQYIFRHVPPPKVVADVKVKPRKQFLTGYGVGLDLKKMDYLALDDRRAKGSGSSEEVTEVSTEEAPAIDPIRELLDSLPPKDGEPINLSNPLTKEEFASLGVQAAQFILNSSKPIETLVQLSQDFPRYATELSKKVEIDPELQFEMAKIESMVPKGTSMLWLNGKVIDNHNDFNPFKLINLLRSERQIMQGFTDLGLTPGQAMEVLTGRPVFESFSQGSALDGIFDVSDREEGGDVIIWLNDLENDDRYSRWPKEVESILAPIYPGSFHSVRLNLWNIVLAVDLSNRESLVWIFKHVSNIINRKFPFRWGIVPLVDTPEGEKAARIFYYVQKHYGPKEVMDFIRSLIAAQNEGETLDFLIANAFFNNLGINVAPLLKLELDQSFSHDYDTVIEGQEPHSVEQLNKAKEWARRIDVKSQQGQLGHGFISGKYYPLDETFLVNLQQELPPLLNHLQGEVAAGRLNSHNKDVQMSTYFYDLPSTPKRRNRYLFPNPETAPLKVHRLDTLFRHAGFEYPYKDLVYPLSEDSSSPLVVTTWVVGDMDEASTMELIELTLTVLSKQKDFRLGLIHAPQRLPMSDATSTPRVSTLLQQLSGKYDNMSPDELLLRIKSGVPTPVHSGDYLDYCISGQLLAREIGFQPGDLGLLINGRVIGPIEPNVFQMADFEPMIAYEKRRRVDPLLNALTEAGFTSDTFDKKRYADMTSTAASIVAAVHIPDPTEAGLFKMPLRPRQRGYRQLAVSHSRITLGDEQSALYHFVVLLDPVSEIAQRWSSLLLWLSRLDSVYLELLMVTDQTREELPLKRFYRSALRDRLAFSEDGEETPSLVSFQNLPEEPIYTLAMDVPPSWLVRPRESEHDLDNIHLASLSGYERITGVKALFDLDFLVIEGHARDVTTSSPPRGLQLQLKTNDLTPIADTLVVENLGYLQFKAKPGVFLLEIMKGRGEDIYQIESVGNAGWDSPPVNSVAGAEITLTSFEGLTLYPRFRRHRGQASADVLKPQREGFISSAVQKVVQAVSTWIQPPAEKPQADINIFTVASGHLYERFASIMISSVMKNTNSTVKFWFIENFLSPSFLEFIPHLAEEYKFEYELVTYKWPSWLRSQREKQRVIWGYKILFLDVLFPMDLKKVIFVDADQIVRTDLQELVDLDLHGAPYGYTPMGDDNTEMEGFRFWKTGYWKDYLRGKPYHISALYVVDLVRFRQLAAGDRLRGHYQQLSADPNSLANLDQDLPNNMQFEVPIFSLDKDWLWCETWCSKDRLDKAKTIDLCQNPLTKEPKLSRARQIPEWSQYDAEIAAFARRLVKEGKIGSSALSAEVDALAGEKQKPATPNMSTGAEQEAPKEESHVQHEEL